MTEEKEPRVVQQTSGGGAGWFVAVLILIAVIFGGYYLVSSGEIEADNAAELKIEVPQPSGDDAGGSGGSDGN